MKRPGLVKASTLEPFMRLLRTSGINLTPHLEKARLPVELTYQDDSWLPKQQVYTFLADVAATHEMEALGLVVGDQICVADLGELGREIYTCGTLEEACLRFVELVPQFAEGNRGSLETRGKETWFAYRTTDHRKGNRDHADHYGLMMLLSIVRLVAGRWYPEEVTIQTGPCRAFRDHPGWESAQVEFNAASTSFAFPSAWLDRPIPDSLEATKVDEQRSYPSNPPKKLNQVLEMLLGAYLIIGGMPSLEMMAQALNMSARTLKRRLGEEGDTYSELTERVRIRAAEDLLRDPGKSVKEVAYILGYSGPNNFIRAFRRILGCTPGEYRKRT